MAGQPDGTDPHPAAAAEAQDAGAQPLAPDPLAGARVVVVDDTAANLQLVEALLRQAGVDDVHLVDDARVAVERCLDLRPDLLLLDLHMPHVHGVDVLERLDAAMPADAFLPVVVLTADTTEGAKRDALRAGAKDFLTKPIDRDELLLRVRNHLETAALYGRLRSEKQQLQVELYYQERATRLAEAERRRKSDQIRRVLDQDLLEMVFQPMVELEGGEVFAVEALARFRSTPTRPPDQWFADAAEVDLGEQLELAAVRTSLARIDDLPSSVALAVNVSGTVAMSTAFADEVRGAGPERVVVELTEHVPVADYDELVAALVPLRDVGVRLAVDDAGSGYANLQHIVRLRPDVLKLDCDLVLGIEHDPARRAMAASMVHFADEIGARLVAEGVETQAALDVLQGLGVDLGQGYHLARPGEVPLDCRRVSLQREQVTAAS